MSEPWGEGLTVGQLIEALRALPADLPVIGRYDGTAEAPVVSVVLDDEYGPPQVTLRVDN